jgi:uncharacterized DUF497 family protein
MRFEWDQNKAETNLGNHDGVSFDEAVETFYDDRALEEYDELHSTPQEQLFIRLGLSSRRLLFVVFVDLTTDETDAPLYRIISARKADRQEQRTYEQFNRDY